MEVVFVEDGLAGVDGRSGPVGAPVEVLFAGANFYLIPEPIPFVLGVGAGVFAVGGALDLANPRTLGGVRNPPPV